MARWMLLVGEKMLLSLLQFSMPYFQGGLSIGLAIFISTKDQFCQSAL